MSIVTITRGAKGGGKTLAGSLASKLGYTCLTNQDILADCASRFNLMPDDLMKKMQEVPGLWHRLTKAHRRYLVYVQCALLQAVKRDNVIYHGIAGQLFLGGIPHVLKTRLEAPMERRVKAAMRQLNLSHDEADKYIRGADEQRSRWVKLVYGEIWQDPSLYDLSFSLHNMSIETITEIVALTLDREEYRTTEKSKKQLNDRSLECEVKAALAADDKLWNLPVTISASDGVVTLGGQVKNEKIKVEVSEVVSHVKSVSEARMQLIVSSKPLPEGLYGHD